jgi:hypothetical protein
LPKDEAVTIPQDKIKCIQEKKLFQNSAKIAYDIFSQLNKH